jgi:hypothetical protein
VVFATECWNEGYPLPDLTASECTGSPLGFRQTRPSVGSPCRAFMEAGRSGVGHGQAFSLAVTRSTQKPATPRFRMLASAQRLSY